MLVFNRILNDVSESLAVSPRNRLSALLSRFQSFYRLLESSLIVLFFGGNYLFLLHRQHVAAKEINHGHHLRFN